MSDDIKKWIREHQRKEKSIGVLLKFEKGKIYWIPEHHRYLDYNDVQKVLLGKGKPPSKGEVDAVYQTHKGNVMYITSTTKVK